MSDPVRELGHSHAALNKLALEVRELVLTREGGRSTAAATRHRLLARLEVLRDELLEHFANEEEGLFPFVRKNVPTTATTIDRLLDAHDAICGAVVRLAHFVAHDSGALDTHRSTLAALYERFEHAYAAHADDEANLLEELGHALDSGQRRQLSDFLRGL
jgi:iron-sulfur cluster repair protein YtfE (RIC family)